MVARGRVYPNEEDGVKAMTPRQLQIYKAIEDSIAKYGRPPTRAELARKFGFASPNAIEEHLQLMQRKGVLKLIPAISRGIQLLGYEEQRTC